MCEFVQNPPGLFTLMMAFRGSYKSTIGTVGRTIQLCLNGERDILIFSEGSSMAEEWSREARLPFEGGNRFFNWLFPELVSPTRAAKWGDSNWQLPNGSRVRAAGIDSQLMGAHVDHLVMDDIFSDPKTDKTPEYAARVLEWVKMSLPLLKDPARNHRYLTGVSWWVEGEPYAYFRKEIPPECQFFLPFEENGKLVWPERYSEEQAEEIKRHFGAFGYASQYLLNPVSQETAVFKSGTIKTYKEKPRDRNYVRVMAVDPAFSSDRRAHSTAIAIGDNDSKGNCWVERAIKAKKESHESKKWVLQQALAHEVKFLGVECNGPQIVYFQELKREIQKYPLYHPVRSIVLVEMRPVKDKVARWNQLASGLGAGQVRIQQDQASLISEMYRVTGAKHESNDLTDAAAHLVGPELSKKRPFRFSDLSQDSDLPFALQDDPAPESHGSSFMSF